MGRTVSMDINWMITQVRFSATWFSS